MASYPLSCFIMIFIFVSVSDFSSNLAQLYPVSISCDYTLKTVYSFDNWIILSFNVDAIMVSY